MNNVQIVKKRLKDLKQLSQNLKRSSQTDSDLNTNIIKVIMNITKDVSNKQQNQLSQLSSNRHSLHSLHPSVEQHLKQSTVTNKTNTKQSVQSNRNTRQSQEQDNKKNRTGLKKILSKSYEQEEQDFKILEQENKMLKQKIKKLQQKFEENQQNKHDEQQSQSSVEFKHMSYFRIKQNVSIFLTKISINVKDYQKIQYHQSQLKLTLDHIRINVQERGIDLRAQKGKKTQIRNEKFVRLDFSDLMGVDYLPNYIIRLKFHDDDHPQYLYMKFDDYQSHHRWDIGLFINFKIIKSLGNNQLFKVNKIFITQGESFRKSQVQKMINSVDLDYQFTHKKTNKQKQVLIKQNFNILDEAKISEEEKMMFIQYLHQKQKCESLKKYIQESTADKGVKFKNEEKNKVLVSQKQIQTQQAFLPKKKSDSITQSIQINERIDKQQKKQGSLNEAQLIKKMKKLEAERSMHQNHIQQLQQQHSEYHGSPGSHSVQKVDEKLLKLDQAKLMLKMGMYVTKYAEGAFNPHEKKLFLSQDELQLRWQDRGDHKYKSILVNDITSVRLGQIGPGIQKHIGKSNIKNYKCFILINLRSKDRKQLQFGMNSVSLMESFAQKLNLFVESLNQTKEKKPIKF